MSQLTGPELTETVHAAIDALQALSLAAISQRPEGAVGDNLGTEGASLPGFFILPQPTEL